MLKEWITSLSALKLTASYIPEIVLTAYTHIYVIIRFGLLTFYLELLCLYSSVTLISNIISGGLIKKTGSFAYLSVFRNVWELGFICYLLN